MNRTRDIPQGLQPVVAAVVVLLAALGACEGGQVAEPEAPLEIEPDSLTLTHLGERFTFTVRGSRESRLQWSVSNRSVLGLDGSGTVTALRNGVSRVVARSLTSVDSAVVEVRQVADVLEAFGQGQRASPGQSPLEPVGVRLLDAGGTPVPRARVRFEPGPGGGRVEAAEVSSDSAGVAVAEWTLGRAPGRQTLRAVAVDGGASVEIAATARDPNEAVALLAEHAGEDQWTLPGGALPEPVVVRALDETGRGIWGVRVRFEVDPGSGRVDPGVALTDSLGLASVAWTLGGEVGEQRLVATASGGVRLAFKATAVSEEGVCHRTPAVSAEIVFRLRDAGFGVESCADVTAEHLRQVIHLGLTGRLRRLGPGDFRGLPNLRTLWLTGDEFSANRLAELPADVFRGLSSLEWLSLGLNQLTSLPEGIFAGLSRLEGLSLSFNQLEELPPRIFADLSRLEELWLSHNPLEELPPRIFAGLSRLEELYLVGILLEQLPPDLFEGLVALEFLVLNLNRLTALPPGVFAGLASLERLYLSRNAIETLSADVFADLSALRIVRLVENGLTALPPGIFDSSPGLREIHLRNSRLTRVPAGVFGGLSELSKLDLASSRIGHLSPRAFEGLSSLEELWLEANLLDSLPPGLFEGVSQLDFARLDGNPGAPFTMQAELGRADASDRLAPGPARVVLRVPAGAPFPFGVPVSVQRGTGSGEYLVVAAGDTVSEAVVVSAGAEGGAAHVSLGAPPDPPPGFDALRLGPGGPLVLFAEAANRTPVIRSAIPAHRLRAGGPAGELALAEYFEDADGDALAHEVASGDAGVVGARIEGGTLWLEPGAQDTTEVVVTARDPGGLRAVQRFETWVAPAPDPDAFNIEVIFDTGFTEEEKGEILRAADRWMEIVTGDLPDVPVHDQALYCYSQIPGPRLVGGVDDLVIRMHMVFGERDFVGASSDCAYREESRLAIYGGNWFSAYYLSRGYSLYETALHEIGHVLGIGGGYPWFDILRGTAAGSKVADLHFPGPLAVEAFNRAGGTEYSGAKVPVEDLDRSGFPRIHWRRRVIPGDVMVATAGKLVTAISAQALADMGHEVDVGKADPYTLPLGAQGYADGAAADADAELEELQFDDVIRGPVAVVDKDGRVVRVIRP